MSNKALLLACITTTLIVGYVICQPTIEPFEKKKTKEGTKDIIGKAKVVNLMGLQRSLHNIIPLRDQVTIRIVNVPLTPFRAPTIRLPPLPLGEKLPPFVLYKPEYLTPVRNQGDCGACWAFSVCDMMSDRAMILSGGLFDQNISVQQMLACFAPDGCDGGSPEEAAYWLSDTDTKLETEKALSYSQGNGGLVTTKCPTKLKGYTVGLQPNSVASIVDYIDEYDYDVSILKSNIENMKLELFEGGPFYCAMTVYDDLFAYTGLEPYTPDKGASMIGGHAIEVIGYCDKGVDTRKKFKKTGYWICKNSWGTDWPTRTAMSGYFTVVMGANICGIESRCGYATPQVYGDKYKGTPVPLAELRYSSFSDYYDK